MHYIIDASMQYLHSDSMSEFHNYLRLLIGCLFNLFMATEYVQAKLRSQTTFPGYITLKRVYNWFQQRNEEQDIYNPRGYNHENIIIER